RRVPDVPRALGACGAGAAPAARLVAPACARRGAAAGVRGDLREHRPLLARVRAVRGPGGPGNSVPAVALPTHAHGDADHRLQARHRRILGRGLPQAGAGADLLPRAVRRAHAHRPGALTPGQSLDALRAGWEPWPAWLLAALVLARCVSALRRHLAGGG